jgi:hypothetical protein
MKKQKTSSVNPAQIIQQQEIDRLKSVISGYAPIQKERDALKLENAKLVAENAELKRKTRKTYISETDL